MTFKVQLTLIYNVSSNLEYFVDTDLDDDDVEFESFTPEDIRGLPLVDLINSCRNRPIASESAT